MIIVNDINEMSELSNKWRQEGKSIGLVPTMGYLHDGHLSLINAARAENDIVVTSIFVNPSQFGPNEDFERYPRDMQADSTACNLAGVDVIFAPKAEEMYPEGYTTYVEPGAIGQRLCGVTRPIHFRGVCTVVLKLFHIIEPLNAYFGQKDVQQYLILKRMTKDLNLNIILHRMPIIREADGLAKSSRNVYLTPEQRAQAPVLFAAVRKAEQLYCAGERDAAVLLEAMSAELAKANLAKIDYLQIVDTENLLPVKHLDREVLVAMAVYFGSTRLIDNTILG